MRRVRDYSIKTKLTLMNILVSGIALLLACAAFVVYDVSTFRAKIGRDLSIRAQIFGANSASAVVFNDPESAAKTLSALRTGPNILNAVIYTPGGQPFATYWRDRPGDIPPLLAIPPGQEEVTWFAGQQITLVRPIVFEGKPIGTIYMRSDLQELNDRLKRYGVIVLAVLLMSLTAAFAISTVIQRSATRPIVQLAETARIVSRDKEYSVRAPATGNHDEVAILIEAFNEMLAQIQERDAALETARDELERRVEQRTAELEATNKELEAFTYSVAHDLRAPLRHIQGFSNMLTEGFAAQIEPAGHKYLQRIVESTQHMGHLINDLLSLAHVGRQELRLQVTGLNSLVQEVLRDLKQETEGREIRWQIGDLPFVDCDAGLMKQVFYNLLSNAAKYTRPRDPAVIDAGHTSLEGQPVMFVRDNGVGFNMKYADKLFGVFQRLHRQEDFEGTGVGLATVQRIIHKHGGRIWADAEIDKGATFFFTLGEGLKNGTQNRPLLAVGGKQ